VIDKCQFDGTQTVAHRLVIRYKNVIELASRRSQEISK